MSEMYILLFLVPAFQAAYKGVAGAGRPPSLHVVATSNAKSVQLLLSLASMLIQLT